ncbi:MAG: aliphatic sulfonate ABC transporter substrate-binding protein [Nostoc sp.]|uniref:aliphatic sulfonate ABC transporter substrate-binding protein n=1 Tax=Nostoc sp. TaxID=1180 RepID=UPI002FFA0507
MSALKGKFEFRKSQRTTRRSLLFSLGYCLMLSTALSSCSEPKNNTQQSAASPESVASSSTTEKSTQKQQVVRIVRSKQLSALAVLEKQGSLEKRLEPLGFKVQWPEFAAGPQQLEALNANGLDIASTAESPPVFSQSAGVPIVYLATTYPSGKAISLLVPVNSPIKSVADLKGKKVAFQKASIGHYLLVKALEDAGLKLSDVKSVFLTPADANAAFSQNKVDAWYIWEPFATRNVQNKIARVLADGGKLRDTGNFYSTSRQFYQAHPDVIKVFLEELQKTEIWTKDHPKEVAQLLAPVTQLDPPTLEIMHDKYDYGLVPITEKVIIKQQQVADKWYSLGLIPKKVNVREGFLTPEEYAKITPADVLAKK